jgi:hypothetical protein
MTWKKVTVSNGLKVDSLQGGFVKRWQAAGAPNDAAVYVNKDAPGDGFQFFFSPRAVLIAGPLLEAYEATNCAEPDLATVDPVVFRT